MVREIRPRASPFGAKNKATRISEDSGPTNRALWSPKDFFCKPSYVFPPAAEYRRRETRHRQTPCPGRFRPVEPGFFKPDRVFPPAIES